LLPATFALHTNAALKNHQLMKALLALSRAIDTLNERVGRAVAWLVLATTLVSAANAGMRYAFGMSSNAWLELQWYLFAAIFLLAAGYTLKHNGHVRIDILYGHLSERAQAWIDLLGALVFLLPFSLLLVWFSWFGFADAWQHGEMSPDSGGLLRWPVRALIPLGFGLLALQGISESIKRMAFLRGQLPLAHERPTEKV
jgi:TRAP-type mannitol/chloroaromatic compound transport system permease small subunit